MRKSYLRIQMLFSQLKMNPFLYPRLEFPRKRNT
nr:MAG TPA: hypothetical protein [Caudoviricetes sp.]